MEDVVTLFKALADEKRIKIIALLTDRELSSEEIAGATGLAPSTISHHLGYLRRAGLVEERRLQYYTLFRFKKDRILDALRGLVENAPLKGVAGDLDNYDRKVLRDYMENGRFTRIPAQQKKRDVLLRYLVGRFDVGQRYPEKEVNLMIADVHDDFATLRRELVDGRFMTRENGIYWRVDDPDARSGRVVS
jgi:biotin operon repressor